MLMYQKVEENGRGAKLAKIAIIAPLIVSCFLSYMNIIYLKRTQILCKIEIQREKEFFNCENFEKNKFLSLGLSNIGALCTKTLTS